MPKTLLFRRPVPYETLLPPGTNTHGLELFHEAWNADGEKKTFLKYELPDVAAVIALTPDRKIVGIVEWQPSVGTDYLHAPGETLEEGEDPAAGAGRGLLEETGYYSDEITKISSVLENSSRSNRLIHVCLAKNCVKKQDGEKGIRTRLLSPEAFWNEMMEYFLADPEGKRGGGSTLKAMALAYRQLGWLAVRMPADS